MKEERNIAVRRLNARGVSLRDIASRLDLTYGTVWNIVNNYPQSKKKKDMKTLESKGEKHYRINRRGNHEPAAGPVSVEAARSGRWGPGWSGSGHDSAAPGSGRGEAALATHQGRAQVLD